MDSVWGLTYEKSDLPDANLYPTTADDPHSPVCGRDMWPPRTKNIPYNETPTLKGNVVNTKLHYAKKALVIAAGFGAGAIASQIIANNSAPKNKLQLVTMFVGSLAIGGIVAHEASRYTDKTFDEIVEACKKIMNEIDTKKEETK